MTVPPVVPLLIGLSKDLYDVTCIDICREPDVVSSPIYEVIAFPVSNQLSYALAGLQSHLLQRNRRRMDSLKRKLAMMRADKARANREEMECDVSSSGARSIRRVRAVINGIAKTIRGHFSRSQQYFKLTDE